MKKQILVWHNKLMWFGLAALVCWALSGLSHPIMAWFGPKAEQFFPPRFQVSPQQVAAVATIVNGYSLSEVRLAKLVPTETGPMLQITEDEKQPRRYFSLKDGQEQANFDAAQARWLASYYTGASLNDIKGVEFVTEFTSDYPWVNRLLPVYRVLVEKEGAARQVAYVYTETNALASLSDSNKAKLQAFFRALHTWSWLDVAGFGRVLVITLLMLTLFAMAVTGLLMVFTLKERKIKDTNRRWHRWLGYLVWLPLLGWSASGFYHLLQAEYVESVAGVRLGATLDLQGMNKTPMQLDKWQQNLDSALPQNASVNALSLVEKEGDFFFRAGVVEQEGGISRNERFAGKPVESKVLYLNVSDGAVLDYDDLAHADYLARGLLGTEVLEALSAPIAISKVTHFGPGYDFRNKRLPVWQVDVPDAQQRRLFVDPASGVLVDQNRRIDRMESLSFSLLHKWNHLVPLMGRAPRDMLVSGVIVLCLVSGLFGLQMHLRRKARKRQRQPVGQTA